MKKLIAIILCVWSINTIAQEESNKNIAETTFEVDGVCEMCKKRIENAVMRAPGVKLAEWNVETHMLKVVYKPSKVNEDELHAAVNAVGHDTEKQKAEDEVYEQIHKCCHYRDEAVIDKHKKTGSGNSAQ
ncbi:MAG: ATPase [Flavobacteriales bacterium]|nr:ATPase [Flavobacteriales bacterium]|tara:strand:+ start:151 stop:540 length:390 start_codon:yes stop_codon:yes gene_type:complete